MVIIVHEKPRLQAAPTWELLALLEPRLHGLEQLVIAAIKLPSPQFELHFRLVRERLAELVGWSSGRRHRVLRSSDAYHVALARLFDVAAERSPCQ